MDRAQNPRERSISLDHSSVGERPTLWRHFLDSHGKPITTVVYGPRNHPPGIWSCPIPVHRGVHPVARLGGSRQARAQHAKPGSRRRRGWRDGPLPSCAGLGLSSNDIDPAQNPRERSISLDHSSVGEKPTL